MSPEVGQLWFRVAIFMTLGSAALVFLQKPDTAEFVIAVTSFIIGVVFIAILVFVIRSANR